MYVGGDCGCGWEVLHETWLVVCCGVDFFGLRTSHRKICKYNQTAEKKNDISCYLASMRV